MIYIYICVYNIYLHKLYILYTHEYCEFCRLFNIVSYQYRYVIFLNLTSYLYISYAGTYYRQYNML